MVNLFKRCLSAQYIHTAESGEYAIEIDGDTLYLLFECSSGAEDWINNFDFPAEPYGQMKRKWQCHRGFLRVWKAMQKQIESNVKGILAEHKQIKKIVCIGYSHGGALCVLATEDMAYLYGDRYTIEGYGFGAPRVLWGKIPHEVKNRLGRFITVRNIPDIVTHLPPLVFGFRNAGTMLRIGKRGKYTSVEAHFPASYIAELEEYEPEHLPPNAIPVANSF